MLCKERLTRLDCEFLRSTTWYLHSKLKFQPHSIIYNNYKRSEELALVVIVSLG